MSNIKLFQNQEIRSHWDADQEQWLFSVIDVVGALTGSVNSRKYWSVLKTRLKKEGSQLATNCSQLKMPSTDGKSYLTDVATTESLLRLRVGWARFMCPRGCRSHHYRVGTKNVPTLRKRPPIGVLRYASRVDARQ